MCIIALGCFYKIGNDLYNALKEQGVNATLINPRYANILDTVCLDKIVKTHKTVITLEDGILSGGFGEKIAAYLTNTKCRVLTYGLKKEYIDRYDPDEILKQNNIEVSQIIKELL